MKRLFQTVFDSDARVLDLKEMRWPIYNDGEHFDCD